MYIVTVAIFKKGLREDLSFWSASEQAPGTVVSVPIRGKYVLGTIVDCEALSTQKASIKKAPFEIRKITSIKGKLPFSVEAMNEVKNFAKNYAVSVSEILGDTITDAGIDVLLDYEPEALSNKSLTYIHEPKSKRIVMYRRFVREALSNKKIIIIVVPTKAMGRRIHTSISTGIEKHVVMGLESGESSVKLFKEICSSGRSVCLITNSKNAFALFPYADVLIIDDCGSRFYTNRKKPHIPYNELLINMAEVSKLKTILAGSYFNIKQYSLIKNKKIDANSDSNTRFLIDSVKIEFIKRDKENWEVFPSDSKNIFESENQKRIFILSPKSGLFPITICNDCKHTLTCKICSAPMKLFERKNLVREYVCPRCANRHTANITCPICHSWNLNPFGIGSERVIELIKEKYQGINVFYIDENSTNSECRKKIKEWHLAGGVLVGSERIMNKIDLEPEIVCLVSVDSMFGIPNYRITERVLETILNASDIATEKTYVITGLEDEYLFSEIKRGTLSMFYADELADRQNLDFPPYGYLLNIRKVIRKTDLPIVKRLIQELDNNIEVNIYTKDQGNLIVIATSLYKPKTWLEKIAPNIPKLFDQSFDIFVNETEWLN